MQYVTAFVMRLRMQHSFQLMLQPIREQAVLETTLRGYSCLTVGDAICVHYNNKKYFIDVIEAQPAQAISVIDTDCQVGLFSATQLGVCHPDISPYCMFVRSA